MLHFMQLAHPRHMDINIQNSKHKGQNTEVTSFEHRTQNICIQNTVSHIGFRSTRVAMFECSPFRDNNPKAILYLVPNIATFEYSYFIASMNTASLVSVAVFIDKHASLRIRVLLHKF